MNNVEHPDHYNKGSIECMDALNAMVESWDDPVVACLCWNAVKYIWRHPFKGQPKGDLYKANYYIKKAIERIENNESKA